MSKRLVIGVALCALSASPAFAQAAGQQVPVRTEVVKQLDDSFGRVDVNHDGFLSREEIASAETKILQQKQEQIDTQVQQEFSKLDTDKSGQLSLAEFKAFVKLTAQGPDEALGRLDTNKDGKVSAAEYKAAPLAAFDKFDANHDGKISAAEQTKARGR
jgi:Ca2+-binding EF-hand superfamily protein